MTGVVVGQDLISMEHGKHWKTVPQGLDPRLRYQSTQTLLEEKTTSDYVSWCPPPKIDLVLELFNTKHAVFALF